MEYLIFTFIVIPENNMTFERTISSLFRLDEVTWKRVMPTPGV